MLTAGSLGLATLTLWEAGISMGRLHEALSAVRESAALTPVAGAPRPGSPT
jgi:hypothetical protein